ncbi:MAG: tRNA (N(6)-L-threonylcarbamoyladenosine(37)-C(2))-methylthiotransferase MtaB [Christensenellales bacterium]
MKICVFTLGCKVNQYDSDAIVKGLKQKGYDVVEQLEYADVYIINTCAVTNEAERKSRQAVARATALNPDCKIFVCGCASQNDAEQFKSKNNVVYVSGTANKLALIDFEKIESSDCTCLSTATVFEETGTALSLRTRHYLKVQDGCNNFCNYCLVPYVRGRSRSRSLENVLEEMNEAVRSTKEIVLTGINLSAYGLDVGLSLTDLINAVRDYDVRIRLGSLEVNVVTEEFLLALKNLKRFCEHFHLSLQSGSDATLKAMNRHYTTTEYKNAVKLIRKYFPDAAITTDIIVGYPTETEEDFIESYEFAKEIAFADIHVFTYSPRDKTVAFKLKPLSGDILLDRQRRMSSLKQNLKNEYNSAFIGRPLEALFENRANGSMCGHSGNYITVYGDGKAGELKTVVPKELYKDGLK